MFFIPIIIHKYKKKDEMLAEKAHIDVRRNGKQHFTPATGTSVARRPEAGLWISNVLGGMPELLAVK